jgi:steroid delta-isomerase-like uncharacterized protein
MDDLRLEGERAEYHWTLVGTNTEPGGTGHRVRTSGFEELTVGDDGLRRLVKPATIRFGLKREPDGVTFAAVRLQTTTEEVLMSDNRAAFDAWIDAFNAHDEAAVRALTADDCVFEGPGGVRLEGGDAVTGYAMVWLNAFSDAKLSVDTVVVDGDWVAMTGTFKGTHDGTLSSPDGDVPATGRTLEGRCSQFVRFVDGKSVEEHLYYDQIDVVTQLGLVPESAGATA